MRRASLQFCSAGAGRTSQVKKAPSALPRWGSRKSRSKACGRRAAASDPNLQQLGVAQADVNTQGGHVHQIQQVQAAQQAELDMDMPGPSRFGQAFAAQLLSADLGATLDEIRQDNGDEYVDGSPEELMEFFESLDAQEQQININSAVEEVAPIEPAAHDDFDFGEALLVVADILR